MVRCLKNPNKYLKRLIVMITVTTLVLSMLPITMQAEDTAGPHICGHDIDSAVTWQAVSTAAELANMTAGGSYYLANNISVSSSVAITGTINLCLNGKVLEYTGSNGCVIHIQSGGTLNLYDGTQTSHTGYINPSTNLWVQGSGGSGEYVTLIGGVITGGKTSSNAAGKGAGIYIQSGTLNMYGGNIAGNKSFNTGGVYLSRGSFNMSSGTICGNAGDSAGGVFVDSGTFTMNGGKVRNNNGFVGGVKVYGGTFNLRGGSVCYNTADTSNTSTIGGIQVVEDGAFQMSGGSVSGNKGASGGVQLGDGQQPRTYDEFTLSGGTISQNVAANQGGGVRVFSGLFTMTDGEITGNSAYYAGGVHMLYGDVHIQGGSVTDNTAVERGGGIACSLGGYLEISGAPTISGNTLESGGDVVANNVDILSGAVIYIEQMTGGEIGITYADGTGLFSDGGADYVDFEYFFSDNPLYLIQADGYDLELILCSFFEEGDIVAEGYEGTYDGQTHGISVTAPAGATITYGTVEGEYNQNTSPVFSEAGTHTVYYKVKKQGYQTVTGYERVEIEPKELTIIWSGTQFVYNGALQGPTATVSGIITGDDVQLEVVGSKINAGTGYVAEARISGADIDNYRLPGNSTITFVILSLPQEIPEVTGVDETIYGKADGRMIGLTTEMEYATREDASSAEYVAVTDANMNFAAGTYYVRYAAKQNYNASDSVEVIIGEGEKLTVTVVIDEEGYILTTNKTRVGWHEDALISFQLEEGYYAMRDSFAVKVNGVAVELDGNGTYLIEAIEEDKIVTVEGVAEIVPGELPVVEGVAETIYGKADGKMIGLTTEMEYATRINASDEEYIRVTNPNMDFAAGTYYVRYAASESHSVSESLEVVIGEGEKLTVTVIIDQEGYILTTNKTRLAWHEDALITFQLMEGYRAVENEFAVKVNGVEVELSADGTYLIEGAEEDKVVTVEGVAEAIPELPPQDPPVVEGVAETIYGKADGKIVGLTTAMEYATREDAPASEYVRVTDANMDFAADTYYVRYAANQSYSASDSVEVIVGQGEKLTVTVVIDQEGYNLTTDKARLAWHEDALITFQLEDGYYAVQGEFAVKVNGVEVELDEDGTYLIEDAEENKIVTVEGVAEINPEDLPQVEGVAETVYGKADGKMIGLTTEMEYATRKNAPDSEYIRITDPNMNFAAGTYYVRYAASQNDSASASVEVIIGVGEKLTVTVIIDQEGYVLTTNKTRLAWHEDALITFQLKEGYYAARDTFAVKVNGVAVELDEDGTYLIEAAEEDKVVTVEGVVEIIPGELPEVEGVAETIYGKADGKMVGLTTEMEYATRINATDSEYIRVTDPNMNFAAGAYYVRYAAKPNDSASESVHVIIGEGEKLTVTVVVGQEGYTLTTDKTRLAWHEDALITFQLKEGYCALENKFAVKVNGVAIDLKEDGTYLIEAIEEDKVVTVEGVVEEKSEIEPQLPPKTGDDANIWIWIVLILVGGACMCCGFVDVYKKAKVKNPFL